jgi:hypothetical protein
MTEPLRVRLIDEHHAAALAHELGDLDGFELRPLDGIWEATVDGVLGDRVVVRVLNAVRRALAGDTTARAVVLLNGREYEVDGE